MTELVNTPNLSLVTVFLKEDNSVVGKEGELEFVIVVLLAIFTN